MSVILWPSVFLMMAFYLSFSAALYLMHVGEKYFVFEGDLTLAGRKEQVCCLNPGVTDLISTLNYNTIVNL